MAGSNRSSRTAPPPFTHWAIAAAFLVIVAFQVLSYRPVLDQGFVGDDFCWVRIAMPIADRPSMIFSPSISGFFRPVVHVCFAANYWLAGLDPWLYNAFNVLLEICCTLGVACLSYRLVRNPWAAIVAAAMFATHPCHAEVVAWISARTSSLLAGLTLLTLLFWIKWRRTGRWAWAGLTLVAFCLALLTKEEAATLFLILLSLDVLILSNTGESSRLNVAARPRYRWLLLPLAVMVGAYLALEYHLQSSGALAKDLSYQFNAGAFVRCLGRLPRLFITKKLVASSPWLEVTFAIDLLLVVAAMRFGSSVHRRVAVFGCTMALLACLPTSFFRIHRGMRYDYVASIGVSFVWAAIIALILAKTALPRWMKAALIILVLVTLPAQARQLHHGLRSWHEPGVHAKLVLDAARDIAPLLRKAAASNQTVCIRAAPLPPLEIKCLLAMVGGVPLDRVVSFRGGEACPDKSPEKLVTFEWDAQSRVFVPMDQDAQPPPGDPTLRGRTPD